MQRYLNLSSDSPVAGYETDSDRISVQFKDGGIYVYTCSSAGADKVESMKRLAVAGRGLATFINTHVRDLYASKR
jgi:hypothetical protein